MKNQYDVLIIGSGISGLSYAIQISEALPDVTIAIVTKSDEEESNTKYAQGGLAVVVNFEDDSFKKHVEDTMRAGDYLCDRDVVEMVIKEGPARFQEMKEWGARFDQNDQGDLDLGREGGHTENRIVHHKDITGFEIERALLAYIDRHDNIDMFDHHFAVDLITNHHFSKKIDTQLAVFGAYVFDRKKRQVKTFLAKKTLLATGGGGQVYTNTTNPFIATGDGFGMAYRAKAKLQNMQFVQFHPTALYSIDTKKTFLISEAVRGYGAKLRLANGEPFMHKYDEREELASRDIVARAIDSEIKEREDDFVTLHCQDLDHEGFMKHFPNIAEHCRSKGIDPLKDPIPVVPAAHYFCGGIVVDKRGETSLPNLFAVGECTCTGLHGANRLASNSLLEAMVYAYNAAEETIKDLKESNTDYKHIFENIPNWKDEGLEFPKDLAMVNYLKKQIKLLMTELVGIVRTDQRLQTAREKLKDIFSTTQQLYSISQMNPQIIELRNLVSTAHIIIEQSIAQKENKGCFYNSDLEQDR